VDKLFDLVLVAGRFTPVVQLQGRKSKYFAIISLLNSIFLRASNGYIDQHHVGGKPKVLWEELQHLEATHVGHF